VKLHLSPPTPRAFTVWTGAALVLPVRFINIQSIFEINSAEIKYIFLHVLQRTNRLASPHKLRSPPLTHGYYGANYSPILTAVYFHDLHAPSWHDVSVQERGPVHCYIHQSHDLHSSPNITCIWNEMVSLNKLPIHLLSLYWKLLHLKVSTSEFFIQFLPIPALPTILKIQLTDVPLSGQSTNCLFSFPLILSHQKMFLCLSAGWWNSTFCGLPMWSHGCGHGAHCSGSQNQQSHEGVCLVKISVCCTLQYT